MWESLAAVSVDGKNGDDEWFIFSVNDNDFVTVNGFYDFGQMDYQDSAGLEITTQALVFKIKLQKHSRAFRF
jgi:hypothetical protein